MSDPQQSPITRTELRALAAELLEQLRAMNIQIHAVRQRLHEEGREIRREAKEGAAVKKPGRRMTVFHEADGSTKVVHD